MFIITNEAIGNSKQALKAIPLFESPIVCIYHNPTKANEGAMIAVLKGSLNFSGSMGNEVILCMCPSEDAFRRKIEELSRNIKICANTDYTG